VERVWKESVVPILRYCPGIFLEELSRTTKYLPRYLASGSRFQPETYRICDVHHVNISSIFMFLEYNIECEDLAFKLSFSSGHPCWYY